MKALHAILILLLFQVPAATAQEWPDPMPPPDWSSLNQYQYSLTHEQFVQRMERIYSPDAALKSWFQFDGTNSIALLDSPGSTNFPRFVLHFAPNLDERRFPETSFKQWRELRSRTYDTNIPLAGLTIALDPGHIGGAYARMEERYFQIGNDRPVMEGLLNMIVAKKLEKTLTSWGAEVKYTKADFLPVTHLRPDDFQTYATVDTNSLPDLSPTEAGDVELEAYVGDQKRKKMELLFYRNAEIVARAKMINHVIQPDLTVCIHFNAVGNGNNTSIVDRQSQNLVYIHGYYRRGDFEDEQIQFQIMRKILENSFPVELGLAETITEEMKMATQLPPVSYGRFSPLGHLLSAENPFLYIRNLAANRRFSGPVVYLEPYYMNAKDTYDRIQAGDYQGEKTLNGRRYRSIYEEYAGFVAQGILNFITRRTTNPILSTFLE